MCLHIALTVSEIYVIVAEAHFVQEIEKGLETWCTQTVKAVLEFTGSRMWEDWCRQAAVPLRPSGWGQLWLESWFHLCRMTRKEGQHKPNLCLVSALSKKRQAGLPCEQTETRSIILSKVLTTQNKGDPGGKCKKKRGKWKRTGIFFSVPEDGRGLNLWDNLLNSTLWVCKELTPKTKP